MPDMRFGRILNVQQTRAGCTNVAVQFDKELWETLLTSTHGEELKWAIEELPYQGGFGIVAPTGAGKTVAIRRICHEVLGDDLRVDVVNMEEKADETTDDCNVIIMTSGIYSNWEAAGLVRDDDLIIIDEIHQTSPHLEQGMLLSREAQRTVIWMSATVLPDIYAEYLDSHHVIMCDTYDPECVPTFEYLPYAGRESIEAYVERELPRLIADKRCMAVFVPTRDDAKCMANRFRTTEGLYVDFYHGGESAKKLEAYAKGKTPRPYLIFMTNAGASALNLIGLNEVAIVDQQYQEIVKGGKRYLKTAALDSNTLLQMIGRVQGRYTGGSVTIFTNDQELDASTLKPAIPEFKLNGHLESLVLVTARAGVDPREHEPIGGLEFESHEQAVEKLLEREYIVKDDHGIHLTEMGSFIESLPVSTAWGEVIYAADKFGDPELLRTVCLTACCSDLHRLTSKEWLPRRSNDEDDQGDFNTVIGSDHLTAYNIVTNAVYFFGERVGKIYKLGKGLSKWCREFGYFEKEIATAVHMFASLMIALDMRLPEPEDFDRVSADDELYGMFVELLAEVQSMDLVKCQRSGETPIQTSPKGITSGNLLLGNVRYRIGRDDALLANAEGTEIPLDVAERYAHREILEVIGYVGEYDVEVRCELRFAGVSLGDDYVTVVDEDEVPADLLDAYEDNASSSTRR